MLKYLQEIDDWEEKYTYIMEIGDSLPKLSPSQKNNQNRIMGCQSRVWLCLNWEKNRDDMNILKIEAEADSRLVSGLIAIVVEIYTNKTKNEMENIDKNWLSEIGLNAVVKRIENFVSISND